MVAQHILRITQRCQVVGGVPLLEHLHIGRQVLALRLAQLCQTQLSQIRRHGIQPLRGRPLRMMLGAIRPRFRHGHVLIFRAADQAACSLGFSSRASKPLKRPFFRWINSKEIAAGVMPEIRDACPKVSGRCLLSFWRASKLRADTCM